MYSLRWLCENYWKIPVVVRVDKVKKPLFVGRVEVKAILKPYAVNPILYSFDPILTIVKGEVNRILKLAKVDEKVEVKRIFHGKEALIIEVSNPTCISR